MIWKLLKHLKNGDAWGDPDKMDFFILVIVDNIMNALPVGCRAKIHCGYKTSGHSSKSMHYHGKAIDFHVVGVPFLTAETLIMADLHDTGLIENVGIGIYPDWNNPGFHIDSRGNRASWAKIKDDYVAYAEGLKYAKTKFNGE